MHNFISILVCSHNNAPLLEQCLYAIRQSILSNYELIVVDDCSIDNSAEIAYKYADTVKKFTTHRGRSAARNQAYQVSCGDILVFIDADVIIFPDALNNILQHFCDNPEISALTGMLSKDHYNENFFSVYKNLYMHYIFSKLPDQVTFLYGSIHAIKRNAFLPFGDVAAIADDTALGQQLYTNGKKISFLKHLEVIHLKHYTMKQFFQNDYEIPFDMAKIFIRFKGWQQLGKNNTGFIHSSRSQLISVAISYNILLLLSFKFILPAIILFAIWFLLNWHFLAFLYREKGVSFLLAALPITLTDHLTMATGIISGFIHGILHSSTPYNTSASILPRQSKSASTEKP